MPRLDQHLRDWRPGPLVETDPMAPDPARALAAVLETPPELFDGTQLPPLWHWIHFLSWPRHGELGADGHPEHGHFLPPIPDRRRMFAGGRVHIDRPLQLGAPAERSSELADVRIKEGRSGEMAFVTVRSRYSQDGSVRFTEEQDYVYRSGESATKSPAAERPQQLPTSDLPWQRPFTGDPVRLFRFSALTANSHRIHYDVPYAREVEAYPDLVVHGPILTMLMTELARRELPDRAISAVRYRLRRPVFAGDPVLTTGGPDGRMAVRTEPDSVNADAEIEWH